ncbi:MAG: TIGR02757 family protein [Actinomycetota bacterium]|nr:TIGR02757 family protein [Actinomycetota bacterium]
MVFEQRRFVGRLLIFPVGGYRQALEELYAKYNRRELVHPDPIEFLYRYSDPLDRELVALISSSLAFGRVECIICAVEKVLSKMGRSPRGYLGSRKLGEIRKDFSNFSYRFADGDQLAGLLSAVKSLIGDGGSLEDVFASFLKPGEKSASKALEGFTSELHGHAALPCPNLLPNPRGNSAMKRLNLFLRWMVRGDEVDPGGWEAVSPSMLIVPLDVHLHRFGLLLGLTERRSANMQTALEITDFFREISPADPLRYDFAVNRMAVRGDRGFRELFQNIDR